MSNKTEMVALINWLLEYDETTLKVAIMYATNYLQYGVDITEKWNTATKQACALHYAEQRGYAEGIKRFTICMNCRYAKRHAGNTLFGKALFDCKHPRYIGTEGLPPFPEDFFCKDGEPYECTDDSSRKD